MKDSEDIVRDLGHLTLGTRFKRIGDRLQSQTQRILAEHGVSIPAGQFPFLAAIDRLGPRPIGELARAVGVTQPAATRTLAQLSSEGLVTIKPSRQDARRKTVALTKRGQSLVDHGKAEVWPLIERAVRSLCRGLSGSLLDQLAAVEDGLAAKPLEQRARRR